MTEIRYLVGTGGKYGLFREGELLGLAETYHDAEVMLEGGSHVPDTATAGGSDSSTE